MSKSLSRATAILLLIVLLLPIASCSQPQGSPVPSGTPDSGVVPGEFTIAWVMTADSPGNDLFRVSLKHLQTLLRNAGWYVTLKMETAATNAVWEPEIAALIRQDAAAGKPCDGYIIPREITAQLLKDGITQDLGTLMPQAAPKLYSKYKELFTGSIAGIPVSVPPVSKSRTMVLYLREDIAGGRGVNIKGLSDVFTLLETGSKDWKIGVPTFSGYYSDTSIFDYWAAEKGYYALSAFGIRGMLYAKADDAQCTPVPIENINGFKEFTDRCRNLVSNKQIIDDLDIGNSTGDTDIGYIGPLLAGMDHTFLLNHQKSGKDFVAFPLAGCEAVELPGKKPHYNKELAVPAASTKALHIMKLLEWILASQANYDLANYGEEGKEYRFVDGRLEPLKNGKALIKEDWNINTTSVYYLRAPHLVIEDSYSHATVYAPANYEGVTTLVAATPPIWSITKLRGTLADLEQIFNNISVDMSGTMQLREDLIADMANNADSTGNDSARSLSVLLGMKAKTEKLVEAVAQKINELKQEQKTGG